MLQDFRTALRAARKDLGSTFAAFLTLTLGIGATTAVFSVVSAVMLRPLPWPHGERLVQIFSTDSHTAEDDVSMADYGDWKRNAKSFESTALIGIGQASLTGRGLPERVITGSAEASLLHVLGVNPLSGRNFQSEENGAAGAYVTLLSWTFWQSHFHGADVLGQQLTLDEKPYTIVGVLPRSVELLTPGDVWVPLAFDESRQRNSRGFHSYLAFARLRQGVSLDAANAELRGIAQRLAEDYPNANTGVSARVVPLAHSIGMDRPGTQDAIRMALLTLLGAVLCVLLIACGNVANLLLARFWSRRRETAVRICLGAQRHELSRQILAETLLLALPAVLAGISLAQLAVVLIRKLSLTDVPRIDELAVDWRVCLFSASVGLVTAIVIGVLPSLRAHRMDLAAALKQAGARTTEAPRERRWATFFVALQAALTVLLLVETGLMLKSFTKATGIKMAFVPDHLLTVYLSLPSSRYGAEHPENAGSLARAVLERVRTVSGVRSAGLTTNLPLMGTAGGGGVLLKGQARPVALWNSPLVLFTAVSNHYFRTLGTPLLAGNDFSQAGPRSSRVVIVNQTFAHVFFGTASPIGQQVAAMAESPLWNEIIGVVADVQQSSIEGSSLPEMYLPLTTTDSAWLGLAVRVDGDPMRYLAPIRSEVAKVDSSVALFLGRGMNEVVDRQYTLRRVETGVVTSFGLIAIALAAVGIYAVNTYSVGQRINEIGLRMAVGASERSVLALILRQAMAPTCIGIICGLSAGYLLARASERLLFDVSTLDLGTYLAVPIVLAAVAAAAAYLPARHAVRTNPWSALREE